MEQMIGAMTTLAAFAAVHERVIELVRSLNLDLLKKLGARNPLRWPLQWLDRATTNHWNIVFGVALALGTRANLLALFVKGSSGPAFFDSYLQPWSIDCSAPLGWARANERELLGCVLMGCSTALGSQFWHDFAYGLIDARKQARAITDEARRAASAPPGASPRVPPALAPPSGFVSSAAPLPLGARRMPPPNRPPALATAADSFDARTPMISG